LGRNDAGKTTTIWMLLGLIKPTFGQVEIFGENLFNNQKSILRRIGSIVEVPGFYENLTAIENLLINAKILGDHKKNTIEEALEIVDLHNETKKLDGKYSIGMNQRIVKTIKKGKNTINTKKKKDRRDCRNCRSA